MKIICIVVFFLLVICSTSQAQELSKQNKLYVKLYAEKYISKDPYWQKALEAILQVESQNGRYKIGKLDPSYGISQMKTSTARDCAKQIGLSIPESEEELKNLLIADDRLAIQLASVYLGYLFKKTNDVRLTLIAYNMGINKMIETLRASSSLDEIYYNKIIEEIK